MYIQTVHVRMSLTYITKCIQVRENMKKVDEYLICSNMCSECSGRLNNFSIFPLLFCSYFKFFFITVLTFSNSVMTSACLGTSPVPVRFMSLSSVLTLTSLYVPDGLKAVHAASLIRTNLFLFLFLSEEFMLSPPFQRTLPILFFKIC